MRRSNDNPNSYTTTGRRSGFIPRQEQGLHSRYVQPNRGQTELSRRNENRREVFQQNRETTERFQGDAREAIKKTPVKKPSPDNPESKMIDTDYFIGDFPFLKLQGDYKKVRDECLRKPNSMYLSKSSNADLPAEKLDDDRLKVRSIIFSLLPEWFSEYFDNEGKMLDQTHFKLAITKLTDSMLKAVNFHKPGRVYIISDDRNNTGDSLFAACLSVVAVRQRWVFIDMNLVGKNNYFAAAPKDQFQMWRQRVKWNLSEFHPRDLPVRSPEKGINCNNF